MFPFAINGIAPIVQVTMLFFGSRLPESLRIKKAYILSGIIMIIIPFIGYFGGSPATKYYFIMALLIIYSALQGIIESAVSGFAAKLNS